MSGLNIPVQEKRNYCVFNVLIDKVCHIISTLGGQGMITHDALCVSGWSRHCHTVSIRPCPSCRDSPEWSHHAAQLCTVARKRTQENAKVICRIFQSLLPD